MRGHDGISTVHHRIVWLHTPTITITVDLKLASFYYFYDIINQLKACLL